MDLDELRHALDEAGRRVDVDTINARDAVDARAGRLRRRQRISLSLVALAVAVAVTFGTIVVVGNRHTPRTLDVTPTKPRVYSPLPTRFRAAMAYDDAIGMVVLFGGADAGLTRAFAETWLWDGHGWSMTHPAVSPPARENGTMAYDPASKQVVLFGGVQRHNGASTTALDDTWTWDGSTWTQQRPRHRPPWSSGTAMSYDPTSRSILLLTLPSKHPNLDLAPDRFELRGPTPFGTWRWAGSDWHELPTPTAPLYATAAAAFHTNPRLTPLPNRAGLLFYSWAVFTGSCPASRGGGSFCASKPDPNGTVYSQTWTWDGTRWTEQHPTRAPGAGQLASTPGETAQPIVFAPGGSVWRWTGTDWTETPAHGDAPAALGGFAVYDAHDADIVAYGQRLDHGVPHAAVFDTWTWNSSWTNRTASVPAVTTTVPTTTASTAARPSDPLGSDAAMLGISGRVISALDAQGHVLKTLVTAFAGRSVTNVQLRPDHRTIWYATKADDNQTCPEIVKLDLQTNVRTVVAHADGFALTPDGTKLLFVRPASAVAVTNRCQPVPYPSGVQIYDGEFVVRDLATGAQSVLPIGAYPSAGTGGPSGHVWMSDSGEELIASNCVVDGCGTLTFTVPKDLNGPIVWEKTKFGPKCGCSTLVSGPNGVYGVDEGSWNDTRNFLRRYDATNLIGPGNEVIAPKDGTLGSIAPTTAGVFVLGVPAGSTTTLYRVTNGTLQVVATLGRSSVSRLFPIPPYAAP
jgi:hypothetical protein